MSGRSSVRNKTLARTLEKVHVLEGWGSGFQRINTMCQEYGVALPEFTEIGDIFRVNFYRRQNSKIGDKSAINFKKMIVEYLAEHEEARSQEIADVIGLKISRTKDYITELVEEGKIVSNGANKNRTYSLKK
ncbi:MULTISPECIES: ATP-binding protein [unclassified Fibrobacter]|uniref:ATP-binding protein n=1 Tax=unclassified Fibrobacter TaxID=2634177 RepID=UPI0020C938F0|nr:MULTISPECIES: ATP-binding protein [unclassified Fibrobacter]